MLIITEGREISEAKSLPQGVTRTSRKTPQTEADSAEEGQNEASTALQEEPFQLQKRATNFSQKLQRSQWNWQDSWMGAGGVEAISSSRIALKKAEV